MVFQQSLQENKGSDEFRESLVDQLAFKAMGLGLPEDVRRVWVRSWNGRQRGVIEDIGAEGDTELIF